MNKKIKENYQLRLLLSVATLIVLGIACLYLSGYINEGSRWKDIVNNLGTAFFFTGVFGIVQEYILKDKLVEVILSKINLKEDVDRTGIERIYYGISDIDYGYYFKRAQNNIDIVHVYGRTWTSTYIDEIEERLASSKCKIRVVLLDPDSLFIPALAEHYGITADELKQRIEDVTKMWKEAYKKKAGYKRKKSSIELYYHKGFPAHSLYRIDERIFFVQTKINKRKSKQLPSFSCIRTKEEKSLYNDYLAEIDMLVSESQKVNWE